MAKEIPIIEVKKGSFILDVLLENKIFLSRSEGKRLLIQEGIKNTITNEIFTINSRIFFDCKIKIENSRYYELKIEEGYN